MASSILESVVSKLDKARRESAEAKVKKLFEDYQKTLDILESMAQQIVTELVAVGESEAEIRAALKAAIKGT